MGSAHCIAGNYICFPKQHPHPPIGVLVPAWFQWEMRRDIQHPNLGSGRLPIIGDGNPDGCSRASSDLLAQPEVSSPLAPLPSQVMGHLQFLSASL